MSIPIVALKYSFINSFNLTDRGFISSYRRSADSEKVRAYADVGGIKAMIYIASRYESGEISDKNQQLSQYR